MFVTSFKGKAYKVEIVVRKGKKHFNCIFWDEAFKERLRDLKSKVSFVLVYIKVQY